MKVLVCGNERFSDRAIIHNELGRLDAELGPFTVVMQFGGSGPEYQARAWAWENGFDPHLDLQMAAELRRPKRALKTFHHDWDRHGPGAHHHSYREALHNHRPDLIIVFGPERGPHRALVRLARTLAIEIIEFAFADFAASKIGRPA